MVVAFPAVTMRPSGLVLWVEVPSPTVTRFIEVIMAGPVATPSVTGLSGNITVGVVAFSAGIIFIGIVFVVGEASTTGDAYHGTIFLDEVSNIVSTRFVASPAVFVYKGINARAVVVLSKGTQPTGVMVVVKVAFPAVIIFVEAVMVSLVAASTVTRQ